ncbi:MAG: hypothetical protein WAM88_09190 [Nitrososphaeraceae archaeon]
MPFQKSINFLIIISAIFSGILTPLLSFDSAFATPEGGETGGG